MIIAVAITLLAVLVIRNTTTTLNLTFQAPKNIITTATNHLQHRKFNQCRLLPFNTIQFSSQLKHLQARQTTFFHKLAVSLGIQLPLVTRHSRLPQRILTQQCSHQCQQARLPLIQCLTILKGPTSPWSILQCSNQRQQPVVHKLNRNSSGMLIFQNQINDHIIQINYINKYE